MHLPRPKKLVNPFEKMAQQSEQSAPPPPRTSQKLTWSERQALAKKQQEEEEERSRAASFKPISPASTGSKWTPPSITSRSAAFGAGSGFTAAAGAEEDKAIPVPPPPPPIAPPLPSAASRPAASFSEPEPEVAQAAPPPPVSQCSRAYRTASINDHLPCSLPLRRLLRRHPLLLRWLPLVLNLFLRHLRHLRHQWLPPQKAEASVPLYCMITKPKKRMRCP